MEKGMKITRQWELMGALVVAVLASGCGTTRYKAYMGPDLPIDELAVMEHQWASEDVIRITGIDGLAVKHTFAVTEQYFIEPGEHEIVFNYRKDPTWSKTHYFRATFNAQAGRKYVPVGRKAEKSAVAWIEELTADGTREKVADAVMTSP